MLSVDQTLFPFRRCEALHNHAWSDLFLSGKLLTQLHFMNMHYVKRGEGLRYCLYVRKTAPCLTIHHLVAHTVELLVN